MVKLFLWSFISYGMTTILVYGSIFNNFRVFLDNNSKFALIKFIKDLLSCVLCTSTWVGFFLSLALFSPSKYLFNIHFNLFFDGMFSAGIVWCINSIIEFFEENRIK